MTTEAKFHAAVNVIRSLPKHGSYQPSHDLMLRFYAYFKQATEGPNTAPKPAFWEVVKKAKWDAWTKLGNMPKEEAMTNYVEELKKIVETMSYTDNVANFVSSLDSFYESVPAQDLELLIGPVIERVRSQPGSPLAGSPLGSREASPTRNDRSQELRPKVNHARDKSPYSSESVSPLPPESDDEDETFMDTVEINIENSYGKESSKRKRPESKRANNIDNNTNKNDVSQRYQPQQSGTESLNCATLNSRKGTVLSGNSVNASQTVPYVRSTDNDSDYQIIRNTLISLQRDLNNLQTKVTHLESSANQRGRGPRAKDWPLRISTPSLTFLILWPIAVNLLFLWLRRKNRGERL
ncbi:unnamed protein product [Bemisia tabaci]|uniref:ACB domain-containing protein n=1 Tax=Bemisia tabaci TaxID=7038 RepID=A0A9P0F8I4_BEMTA|nr:PREDICTED: acyl-CoA-binding domain-containing protein 4 [Bemisia tabaci]CAH0394209.1 unnamed protein product [Bemisia tabaci]